jgi:hypothetical protein
LNAGIFGLRGRSSLVEHDAVGIARGAARDGQVHVLLRRDRRRAVTLAAGAVAALAVLLEQRLAVSTAFDRRRTDSFPSRVGGRVQPLGPRRGACRALTAKLADEQQPASAKSSNACA